MNPEEIREALGNLGYEECADCGMLGNITRMKRRKLPLWIEYVCCHCEILQDTKWESEEKRGYE